MIDYQDLLARLDKVRHHGRYATARCPAHDDHDPSLSIRDMGADGIAVKCFASTACDTDAIARAVGLDKGDLLPDRDDKPRISDTYPYHGPDGELLFEVVRYLPKTFKQRRPNGKGGWTWNLTGVQRVPYRLVELREAIDQGRWVILVEGEKDADRLVREDMAATTTPQGAANWDPAYAEWFAGGFVAIIPDNDPQGEEYAAEAAEAIARHAREVRVVRLDGIADKGDVSDWMRTHTRQDLEAQIRAAGPWRDGGQVPAVDVDAESVTMTWPDSDVRLRADRLHWAAGYVHGELSVYWHGRALIEYQRVNCQSASARRDVVTELNRYDKTITWHELLSKVFAEAVRRHRTVGRFTDMRIRPAASPPSFLVGDMWPDMARPSLLFGDSESAKSTITLALLLSIASGRTLIAGAEPYRTGPVAFLDWEDDADLFDYRLQLMARSSGVNLAACHPIHYHNPEAPLHQIADSLSGQLTSAEVLAVAVDSRAAAQAGSLSSDDDTNAFFDAVRKLDCRCWIIDHLDKNTVNSGGKAKHSFGSVFVRGRVASSWFVKANYSTASQKIVTLTDAKWNHGATRPERSLTIDWVEGVRIDRRGEVWQDPEPGIGGLSGQKAQVFEWLQAHPAGASHHEISAELGLPSAKQAQTLLYRLREDGFVQQVGSQWHPLNAPF